MFGNYDGDHDYGDEGNDDGDDDDDLVLHPRRKSLIEPKIIPPFHCHQVPKPLRIRIIMFKPHEQH